MSGVSPAEPLVLVIMGVSGSGKTTVGKAVAERLGWVFKEGDELHPPANIAKMSAGVPLTDADRAPWLAAVGRWIDGWIAEGQPGVISCSALKRAYRQTLSEGRPQVRVVYIQVPYAVVAERLAHRKGHFMPPGLLSSQFAALEEPKPDEGVLTVNGDQPLSDTVDALVSMLV